MGYEFLVEDIERILNKLDVYSQQISPDKLFKIIMFAIDKCNFSGEIEKNIDFIISCCKEKYFLFYYYLILGIRVNRIKQEECNTYLEMIESKMSNVARSFIKSQYMKMKKSGYLDCGQLFSKMIEELRQLDTKTATQIIIDLYKFNDFQAYFKLNKPLLSTFLDAYYIYVPNLNGDHIFNGATVIAKLLDTDNESVLEIQITKVIGDKFRTTENIEMIGCGGSSMVFKIGNKVLKIGENRSNRKIFMNHRILVSEFRKLIESSDNVPQFYIEIMHCIKTGDITKEELEELRMDLYRQGIVWYDAKVSNCGVLPDGYKNEYNGEIDYEEVAANINVPTRKLQFQKRKRRVVALDSDDMEINYGRTSG